jgi:Outer membrane protein beta-barrel domain
MKTKAIAFTAALLVGGLISQAQTATTTVGKTTFGVRAGINFQNITGDDENGDDLDFKLKTGFHVGVNAEIPIAPEFYLQPGVLFSTKGAKADDGADTKVNISYLEIPVNFLYKPVLGTGKLLLGFGPYAAFGVGGKIKSGDDDVDIKFDKEVNPASPDVFRTLKRFDFGANFLVGYEFTNKFSAQLNAQLGLVKINPEFTVGDTDAKYKNTGFGVSVGYRF